MNIMDNLTKMVNINPQYIQQLQLVQTMLGKLPKEEQVRVVTVFTTELQKAVDKVEGKLEGDNKVDIEKKEDADLDK